MKIVVLPGDGIGPETMAATLEVLQAASARFDLDLQFDHDVAGHESLTRHGATVTPALLAKVKAADGLMLGPMATYDFKDEAKGEINPSKFFRKELDLYANIRPARTWNGVPHKVDAFDLVVVRENTEGFYADRNIESGASEMLITSDVVISLRRITRHCCERIARSAFELAMTRQRHVSIVHKANVLKIGDGMFIDECRRVALEFPEVRVDDFIVDAMMAHVVRAPQKFDVIVTTNMFGDILSDLIAALVGGMGMAPSGDIGDRHALFQPAHGTAPDITGQGKANPTAMLLSAAMMLQWLADRDGDTALADGAALIERAVERVFAEGQVRPMEFGGPHGTAAITEAVVGALRAG